MPDLTSHATLPIVRACRRIRNLAEPWVPQLRRRESAGSDLQQAAEKTPVVSKVEPWFPDTSEVSWEREFPGTPEVSAREPWFPTLKRFLP